MKDISIIIPYHRNSKMLYTSLQTLQESIDTFKRPIEIIVVANNLNSGEIQLDLEPSKYKLLQFEENLFYPGAILKGAEIANGDYLICADPDIFYCENWLENMLKCFHSHENAGGVGAKLINPVNNRIFDFGIGYHGYHTVHCYRGLPYQSEICRQDINVQSICSALFLMKHTLFDSLNGYDQEMPYAYCDNDLCLRIKNLGYDIWGAADALAYHKGSTDNQNSKYYAFNCLREDCAASFFYKNKNRYYDDYHVFFEQSYRFYNQSKNNSFVFINLSTAYDWKSYMQVIQQSGLSVLDVRNSVVKERNIFILDLFNQIDEDLISLKTPLIYFVDSFLSCYNNSLWYSLREIHNDIVIDRNGN